MWQKLSPFIPSWRWILALVVLTLIFVVMRIPASWGAYLMTQGNGLGMSGLSGSLWQGRAGMTSVEIDGQHYSLGVLQWRLSPWSLLILRPCADLQARLEGQNLEGRVCASLSGAVRVTDTQLEAPAQLIQAGIAVPIDGRLSANIKTLAMKNQQLSELDANVSWTRARINAEGRWYQLGAFAAEARYDPEADALVADTFDLEGPIDLEATLRLPLSGGIFIQGELALDDAFSRQIQASEWLPLVLDARGENRYGVDLQF